jgi:hypothetical protein
MGQVGKKMILLLKTQNGVMKQAVMGFSWTTLFFGFFVPLFRGDLKWFVIMIICDFLSFGITNIIFSFIYNKLYIKKLLENGYMPADDYTRAALISKGLII